MRIVVEFILDLIVKLHVLTGELKYKLKLFFIKKLINNNKSQFDFIAFQDLKRWFFVIILSDKQMGCYVSKIVFKHSQTYSEIAMYFFGNNKPFLDKPLQIDNNYPLDCHLNQETLDFLEYVIVKPKSAIEVRSFISDSAVFWVIL